jgi:hypothetical protein
MPGGNLEWVLPRVIMKLVFSVIGRGRSLEKK